MIRKLTLRIARHKATRRLAVESLEVEMACPQKLAQGYEGMG
jgi:hypothetical protein